jgi:hypothetical protein
MKVSGTWAGLGVWGKRFQYGPVGLFAVRRLKRKIRILAD